MTNLLEMLVKNSYKRPWVKVNPNLSRGDPTLFPSNLVPSVISALRRLLMASYNTLELADFRTCLPPWLKFSVIWIIPRGPIVKLTSVATKSDGYRNFYLLTFRWRIGGRSKGAGQYPIRRGEE